MQPSSAIEALSWWEWVWSWFFTPPQALPPGEDLLRAVEKGDVRRVKSLLAQGVKPDQTRSVRGETALIAAARLGRREIAGELMAAGADPAAKDTAGNTPVSAAAAAGHTKILERIAEVKPEVFHTEEAAMGLRLACLNGQSHAVCVLLENGTQVHAWPRGFPCAVFAAAAADAGCLSEVIAAGAEVNEVDGRGWTPLHHAAAANEHTCVRILLAHNARVDARDHMGRAPKDVAVTEYVCRMLEPLVPLVAPAAHPPANGLLAPANPH